MRAAGAHRLIVIGTAVLAGLAACDAPHHVLDPASDAAARIEWLWWVLFWVSLVVFVVVIALWAYALFRRRPENGPEPEGRSMIWILVPGGLLPALILGGLTVITILTDVRIYHPARSAGNAMVIDVVGHQFWWEARYPDAGVVTANEIHVPAGEPVRLRLTSSDVIHSFWVPRLHGKLDLTPGRTTELVLHPEQPGVYRGFCAEFCGIQHALMGLLVIALPRDEFDAWLEARARPADPPADPDAGFGLEVFVRHDCHHCHLIRGAPIPHASGAVGPDLTHLGSRRTLGAVTVGNSPEALARWVLDPHAIKPGVLMPPTPMPADELRALVRYLSGMR